MQRTLRHVLRRSSEVREVVLLRRSTVQQRSLRSSPSNQAASSSTEPAAIAEAFLHKFVGGKAFVSTQLLDANQLRLFSLTLDRPYLYSSTNSPSLENDPPKAGTPLPPFYHYAYFTPAQLPGVLGLDGTDTSFNPSAPFTRRMWAGGSVSWPGASTDHYLRVGDTVTETTKVLSCEPKTIKSTGESMLVVGVLKEFRDSQDNLCVADRRNWVFREALDPSRPASAPLKPPLLSEHELDEMGKGKYVQRFCRDPVTLFRFSALTFNGHRIHYDKPWAVDVEGHRDVVVHGPMNLMSMLDLWRDKAAEHGMAKEDTGLVMPKSIDYRATSPVYAGEAYRVLLDMDMKNEKTEIRVVSDDGTVCAKGTVTN